MFPSSMAPPSKMPKVFAQTFFPQAPNVYMEGHRAARQVVVGSAWSSVVARATDDAMIDDDDDDSGSNEVDVWADGSASSEADAVLTQKEIQLLAKQWPPAKPMRVQNMPPSLVLAAKKQKKSDQRQAQVKLEPQQELDKFAVFDERGKWRSKKKKKARLKAQGGQRSSGSGSGNRSNNNKNNGKRKKR